MAATSQLAWYADPVQQRGVAGLLIQPYGGIADDFCLIV